MAFITTLPFFIWAVVLGLFPEWMSSVTLSVPETIAVSLALVLLLVAFFRQWHWIYWCGWVGSFYAVIQLGLQRPLSEPEVGLLYEALPVVLSLSALLLAFAKKPLLLSRWGLLVLIIVVILPLALLLPSVASAFALLSPVDRLTLPIWQDSTIPVGIVLLMVAVGGAWATYLQYKGASAFAWSHWALWLCFMWFLVFVEQTSASTWAALAAISCLFLALIDHMTKLAYIDELTGLPQRRALMGQLQHLRKRSAVCMLDVDYFKKFNDRYGHDVGDQVLRLLGRILKQHKGFKAYRYGGEEFTLVFFHNDSEKVKQTLDSVRTQVADYPLKLRDAKRPDTKAEGAKSRGTAKKHATTKVTISLGATLKAPNDTPETLLKRADENLYAAKKAGRNRLTFK